MAREEGEEGENSKFLIVEFNSTNRSIRFFYKGAQVEPPENFMGISQEFTKSFKEISRRRNKSLIYS